MLIVTGGVPVNAVTTGADLECALQYGNDRSVTEHLLAEWKKIGKHIRSQNCSDIKISRAQNTENLRVSPLAAVVTHKVRTIYDLSFDEQIREKKGGLKRH